MRFHPDGDVPFQLERILNQGLELDDNFRGAFVEFSTKEGEQRIEHNLGYTPIGWFVLYSSEAILLWKGDSSWNSNSLSLRSSVPNVTVRLFVL